mgnify:CR=1 FL=1
MPCLRLAGSTVETCNDFRMNFSIGECVSILNETGSYTIIKLDTSFAWVEDEHGFDQKIPIHLVVQTKPIITDTIVIKDEDNASSLKSKKGFERIPSIDLHIESLLDADNHMTSFDKLNLQIRRFREFVNLNLEKRKNKVLVIHGIGEGRLKGEIMAIVYRSNGYEMNDANYSPQGVGASYIEITLSVAQPI